MANKQLRVNRRLFLKGAAAVAAPLVIPASVFGAEGRPAPSNRITMGFVGVGGQGSGDMGGFMGFPEVQNVAVCDVDSRPPAPSGRPSSVTPRTRPAASTRAAPTTTTSAICGAGRISTPSSAPRLTTGMPW